MNNYRESTQSPYSDSVVLIIRQTGEKFLDSNTFNYILTGNEPVHTVMEGETLQSIAFFYFKDSGNWYKIADVNELIDPIEEFYVGQQLIIPIFS